LQARKIWQGRADSAKYLGLAYALDRGYYGAQRGANYQPEAVRPPGYPAFLWLLVYQLRLPLIAVVALQALSCLIAVWLMEKLLIEHDFDSLPFLILVALAPFAAVYAARLMAEGPAIFLIALLVYWLSRPRAVETRIAIAIGLLTGIAVAMRPDLALLPPIIAGLIWWRNRAVDGLPRASTLRHAGAMLLLSILVLVPQTIRNADVFGKISPMPPAGAIGHSLYYATWQRKLTMTDIGALQQGSYTLHSEQIGFAREVRRINARLHAPLNTEPFNPEAYQGAARQIESGMVLNDEAKKRIASHPLEYARHVVVNWWRLWNTAEYPAALPGIARTFLTLASALVWFLGFGGVIWALRQKSQPLLKFPALILLYFPIVHCWLHVEARYTAPARLLLAMMAALWITTLLSRRARRIQSTLRLEKI